MSVVDRWNRGYFDGRLSHEVLAELRTLDTAEPDAVALADRAFRLMRVAGLRAEDVTEITAWAIGYSMPRTVPSAWSGTVPPVTSAGRHRKLDAYVAGNPWHQPDGAGVFVDVGCGFPPVTTVETARALRGWRVIGVDPSFGRYAVYDEHGTYAVFDDHRRLRYFEDGHMAPDPGASSARFRDLLEDLLPRLAARTSEVSTSRGRLVLDPVQQYGNESLEFVRAGIGEFAPAGGADVVRCMNVFMYFDHAFRRRALTWAADILRPGGLMICGSDWVDSASSRYTVYRKEHGHLVAREFALSIDNVRPIELAPWYALHDDNLDNLANAHTVGLLRTDREFRDRYDERMDALLAEAGICRRGPDGYLHSSPTDIPIDRLTRVSARTAEALDSDGLVERAATALHRHGRHAWRNNAGHLAAAPADPPPLPPPLVS